MLRTAQVLREDIRNHLISQEVLDFDPFLFDM
jgi:hypothetical protein